MRALILILPLAVAFAGDLPTLEEATRQWADDSAEVRDAASQVVAGHLRRELKPIVAALASEDPEVRRRARKSLEAFLPPRPPVPPSPEGAEQQVAGRVLVNNARGGQRIRFVVNGQRQIVLLEDEAEEQQLKEKGISGHAFTDPVAREQLAVAEGRGFAVRSVEKGSFAAELGIQENDILLSIDGQPVMQAAEVVKALSADAQRINVLRRGKLLALGQGTPAPAPPAREAGEGK